MKGLTPRLLLAGSLAAGLLAFSACGPGYQDLPLPGTGTGGDTYRLEVRFDDAVNLARGAQVKMDGLPVGRVQEVRAEGFEAVADLAIESDITIPAGSTARLRYDTPLGELFVELDRAGSGKPLGDGGVITTHDTSTAPSVEDTLAQASLLINGGGLTEIQTIDEELNSALGGREDVVRDVLERSLRLVRGANGSRADLDHMLRNLNQAARALARRRGVFKKALAEVGPLADMLRADTPALERLLRRTTAVTARANTAMARTQDQSVQILDQLGPILEQILSVEPEFVHELATLPRADDVLSQMIPGDFIGLDALIHLDLTRLLDDSSGVDGPPGGGNDGDSGLVPDLPALLGDAGPLALDPLGQLLPGLTRQERSEKR